MTTPTVTDWTKAPVEWYRWARDLDRLVVANQKNAAVEQPPSVTAKQDDPAIYTDASPDTTRKTLILSSPYDWSIYEIVTKSRQGSAEIIVYVAGEIAGYVPISPISETHVFHAVVALGSSLELQVTNVVGGLEGIVVQFNATRELSSA